MLTLVLVLVGALVLAALVVAGGGLDRTRRRHTRVVQQPVERVVVEQPVVRVRRRGLLR